MNNSNLKYYIKKLLQKQPVSFALFEKKFIRFLMFFLSALDSSLHDNRVTANMIPRQHKIDISLSIVIPVHNPKKSWIDDLCSSLLANDYDELIFVVSGNNSTEIQKLISQYNLPAKVFLMPEVSSISLKTNEGIRYASSDFIIFVDQDDVVTAGSSYLIRQALSAFPNADWFFSEHFVAENLLDLIRKPHLPPSPPTKPRILDIVWLAQTNYLLHMVGVRKTVLHEIGLLDPEFDFVQDWDMALKLSQGKYPCISIPIPLYGWRLHTSSTSSSSLAKHDTGLLSEELISSTFPSVFENQPIKQLINNNKPSGIFRAVGALNSSQLFQLLVLNLECVFSDDSFQNDEIAPPETEWILLAPKCSTLRNFEIDDSCFKYADLLPDNVGMIFIPTRSKSGETLLMDSFLGDSSWSSATNFGNHGSQVVIRRVFGPTTPFVLIKREIFIKYENLIYRESCATFPRFLERISSMESVEMLIDGGSQISVGATWLEKHSLEVLRQIHALGGTGAV